MAEASFEPYFRSLRFVRVGDLRVRYVDAGDGPVVFLLHGTVHSVFGWRHLIGPLVDAGYRVLAVDTPGFGHTTIPNIDHDFGEIGEAVGHHLAAVLDTFCIDRCEAVVGHSLGGSYATILALLHADRVRRVVLVAPGIGRRPGLLPRLISNRLVHLVARHTAGRYPRERYRRALGAVTNDPSLFDERELADFQEWASHPANLDWLFRVYHYGLRWRGLRPKARALLHDRLGELAMPVLLCWGTGDRIVPFRDSAEILAKLQRGRLETFEGAGHMVTYEAQERLSGVVLDFLREPAD